MPMFPSVNDVRLNLRITVYPQMWMWKYIWCLVNSSLDNLPTLYVWDWIRKKGLVHTIISVLVKPFWNIKYYVFQECIVPCNCLYNSPSFCGYHSVDNITTRSCDTLQPGSFCFTASRDNWIQTGHSWTSEMSQKQPQFLLNIGHNMVCLFY